MDHSFAFFMLFHLSPTCVDPWNSLLNEVSFVQGLLYLIKERCFSGSDSTLGFGSTPLF